MGFLKKISESYWKTYKENNPIVRNPDKIDLMITKDNGAELYIFTDKHCLDSSENNQRLIRDKIDNYIKYVNSDDFKKKLNNPSTNNTDIIIKIDEQPESTLMKYLISLSTYARDKNVNIKISIKNKMLEQNKSDA